MVTKVATIQEVHDQVEVLPILKGVVHVHDERVVDLSEDLALVHHRFYASLRNNSSFTHLFHGVLLLRLLPLHLPDLAEATLSNAVEVSKIGLGQRYRCGESKAGAGGLTCDILCFELCFEMAITHL